MQNTLITYKLCYWFVDIYGPLHLQNLLTMTFNNMFCVCPLILMDNKFSFHHIHMLVLLNVISLPRRPHYVLSWQYHHWLYCSYFFLWTQVRCTLHLPLIHHCLSNSCLCLVCSLLFCSILHLPCKCNLIATLLLLFCIECSNAVSSLYRCPIKILLHNILKFSST